MRKSDLLLFLHISKTGGTSLSSAVAQLFPPDCIFGDNGNLSIEYIEGLGDRLDGGGFLTGHCGLGVVAHLRERADIITLLRAPEDQAISNYLHVRGDPGNQLYHDANDLTFSEYLQQRPFHIIFQAGSIYISVTPKRKGDPVLGVRSDLDRILDVMESMLFVGVLERAVESCAVLSRLLNTEYPLELSHLNTAVARGAATAGIDKLREQYRALSRHPRYAPLFDIEARVYAKACEMLDRRVAELGLPAPDQPGASTEAAERTIRAQRFFSSVGKMEAGSFHCPLDAIDGCLIYGPYDRVGPGSHDVEFYFNLVDMPPKSSGSLQIEVVADGKRFLASRVLMGPGPFSREARTLTFTDQDGSGVLEFRIGGRGFPGGRLVFDGAQIREASCSASGLSEDCRGRLGLPARDG